MNELFLIAGAFVLAIGIAFVVLFAIIESLQNQLNHLEDQLRNVRYGYVHGQEFSDLKEEVRQIENHFSLVVIDGPEGKEIRQAVYE